MSEGKTEVSRGEQIVKEGEKNQWKDKDHQHPETSPENDILRMEGQENIVTKTNHSQLQRAGEYIEYERSSSEVFNRGTMTDFVHQLDESHAAGQAHQKRERNLPISFAEATLQIRHSTYNDIIGQNGYDVDQQPHDTGETTEDVEMTAEVVEEVEDHGITEVEP